MDQLNCPQDVPALDITAHPSERTNLANPSSSEPALGETRDSSFADFQSAQPAIDWDTLVDFTGSQAFADWYTAELSRGVSHVILPLPHRLSLS